MLEKPFGACSLAAGVPTAEALVELAHQLRTSEQMFDAAFHSAAIAKALVDLGGHCVEVNESLAVLLGYRADELTGMHFSEFTHPEDIDADWDLFNQVMRGERNSYQLEKRYLHRDGRAVDVLLSATVVREIDGTPIRFISEIVDLTERKRARLCPSSSERDAARASRAGPPHGAAKPPRRRTRARRIHSWANCECPVD
jgi:two-component system cell cycle sensor histidine kinase/response regulator CckA